MQSHVYSIFHIKYRTRSTWLIVFTHWLWVIMKSFNAIWILLIAIKVLGNTNINGTSYSGQIKPTIQKNALQMNQEINPCIFRTQKHWSNKTCVFQFKCSLHNRNNNFYNLSLVLFQCFQLERLKNAPKPNSFSLGFQLLKIT